MAELKVICTNQQITWLEDPAVMYAGNKNIDSIMFSFCELWDGFVKTAIFYRNKDEAYQILLDENNKCIIPPELSQENGLVYVGVIGDKGDKRRTTEPVCWYLREGIPTEGLPSEPTPDIYQQILFVSNEAYKIACSVRDELENGDYSGIVIDDALSETSENAIQNKVVTYWVGVLEKTSTEAHVMAVEALRKTDENEQDIAELNEKVVTALNESSTATEMASVNAQKIAEVEENIGDIDTVLDAIIAIQEALIGGGTE